MTEPPFRDQYLLDFRDGNVMLRLIEDAWSNHKHGVDIQGPVRTTKGDVFYVSFDPKKEVMDILLTEAVAHAFVLAFETKNDVIHS